MDVIKEPSPMREAQDSTPEPRLSPPPTPISESQPQQKPRPARSRPIINKSLLGGLVPSRENDENGKAADKNTKGARSKMGRAAKSIFGVVVGTLKKAELEDKKRNATEAAKKRAIIDSRLQNKIARETASVRRAEENKRDRQAANRKEEDIALKESLFKLRQSRGRSLANFLRTDDDFLKDEEEEEEHDAMDMDDDRGDDRMDDGPASDSRPRDDGEPKTPLEESGKPTDSSNIRESLRRDRDRETKERQRRVKEKAKIDLLLAPARGHPPAIYYMPKILLPSQRRFVERRREAITKLLDAERDTFMEERKSAVVEIRALRQKVEDEDAKLRAEKRAREADNDLAKERREEDVEMGDGPGGMAGEREAEAETGKGNGKVAVDSEGDDPDAEGEEMEIEDETEVTAQGLGGESRTKEAETEVAPVKGEEEKSTPTKEEPKEERGGNGVTEPTKGRQEEGEREQEQVPEKVEEEKTEEVEKEKPKAKGRGKGKAAATKPKEKEKTEKKPRQTRATRQAKAVPNAMEEDGADAVEY